jgi:hypothetical protein
LIPLRCRFYKQASPTDFAASASATIVFGVASGMSQLDKYLDGLAQFVNVINQDCGEK